MDEHTIVRILLEYYTNNFKLWQVARLINKEITSIVNAKPYDKACYGRSTFIRTEWCSICQKNNPKAQWIRYHLQRTKYITHCPTWSCRVSALHSMIAHCRDHEQVLLRVPWKKTKEVVIPRSNGSESYGSCKINSLVKKPSGFYVETEWEDGERFVKLIPLNHYTTVEPKIMSI